jgi:Flp pilus assembly protein TadG
MFRIDTEEREMAYGRKWMDRIRAFGGGQSGSAAVTFALAIVPLLLCVGVAVDYMRYATARTSLQSALDAGALAAAAAEGLGNQARAQAGDDTFLHNLTGSVISEADVKRSFNLTGNTLTAKASFELPVTIMRLAGFDNMSVEVESQVEIPGKLRAEIALVLDYSGSMSDVLGGQVKYVAMKNAAKKLVDDLAAANPKNIKFALVPFSHHVWVSMPKQYVKGQSGTGTWTGCTQDRLYPLNLGDSTPTSDDATKWGQPISTAHASSGCSGYVPNHLVVQPLTDNFAAIDSQLDAMRPYAWTHIALGAEFGFQVLSPGAPFTEGSAYTDKSTRKIMVLLTDGMQTEPAFGPGVRNVVQGEKNLTSICGNAKDKGIRIITIAYNIDDSDTVGRLRDCTSNPDTDFFNIDSSNNVAGAFDAIRSQITAQVRIGK